MKVRIIAVAAMLSMMLTGCSFSRAAQPSEPWTGGGNAHQAQTSEAKPPIPNEAPGLLSVTDEITDQRERRLESYAEPPAGPPPIPKVRPKVKGIYVSGWAASTSKLDQLIELVNQTELNAMVIDVKNDSGQITYDSSLPIVHQLEADSKHMIPDIQRLILTLNQHRIYTIARIAVFKDPYAAVRKPEWAIRTREGALWKDAKGSSWVDPYHTEVCTYAIELAKEAADLGFDEIQFDYVRFPDNGSKVDREAVFQNPNGLSKSAAVQRFLKMAKQELAAKGVYVSADVFGLTTSVSGDMGIGQTWEDISSEIDIISPMVYPSHYGDGVFGIKNPDLQPYVTVQKALADGLKKNEALTEARKSAASIRPWLQDFTATWLKPHKTYGSEDVRAQVQAAKELGIDEYLLWNAKCTYTFR